MDYVAMMRFTWQAHEQFRHAARQEVYQLSFSCPLILLSLQRPDLKAC